MRDLVQIEIDAPLADVARKFADPTLSETWMKNTRYEPVSAHQYRLATDRYTFDVTVLARDLPRETRFVLEAPGVTVNIRASFVALSPRKTLLTSDEQFEFKGLMSKAFALLSRGSIRNAHREQMESFKSFAEATG